MTEVDIYSGPDDQPHEPDPVKARKERFDEIFYAQGPNCLSPADYVAVALFMAAAICLAFGLTPLR